MRIERLHIPERIDAPDAADFIEMVRVRNEIEADLVGNHDLAYTPAELLPAYQRQRWEPKTLLVARVDDRIVARGIMETGPVDDESPMAWLVVEVLREYRNHGIGTALADAVERLAIDDGRSILQSYVPQAVSDDPDVITASTGFGAVPRNSPSTRFLLRRGYTLEQVERMSRLDLPVDPEVLDDLLAAAVRAAGPDYRIDTWTGRTPEERLADIALLRTRMGTDAPAGGLEPDETVWTADRVRDEDDKEESSPRTLVTALVEHSPTGTVAGFTELSVPPERHRPVGQGDTIVLSEHRGHRLGMLLKLVNIANLEEVAPGHPSITTFNAEENRHMLAVNEAIGFVPWGYEGGWKRTL